MMIPPNMQRRKIIVGNWKMNKTRGEAVSLAEDILKELGPKFNALDVVICPPFTCIRDCVETLGGHSRIAVGAQNVHQETSGAYTGEISARMLRDLFCQYVIIGHSERRAYFNETDALVNAKVKACFPSNLTPLVCVGETLEEREANKTLKIISSQIEKSLKDLTETQWADTLIAYEPVWAIGTGRNATAEQAQEVHASIRSLMNKLAGEAIAQKTRILYGGSVKPENIEELIAQPDIDGALVGGASLESRSFLSIIKSCIPKL